MAAPRKCFVTGCAGFIASNLTDRLLNDGHSVVGYDNFSTGQHGFLEEALKSAHFNLIRADLLDLPALTQAMAGCDFVFHLAANADVRFGTSHPRKDLEQNTIGTFHVLEAMRSNGIKNIAFASTGSVYGEPCVFPTPEDAPFPVQTSLYGASKLASEGLIQAYPKERQALMAQMAAARICLKRLNRPEDALKFYNTADASPVPHLDLEPAIQAGRKEALAAQRGGQSSAASAGL